MSKINVMLYGGFNGNDKNRAEIITCDRCEECSLYKRGLCINVTVPFGSRCKIGKVSCITGYTKRARARYDFDEKYRNDEKYGALQHPLDWYVETAGETVMFNLIYAKVEKRTWKYNEWVETKDYKVNECGFRTGEVSMVERKELTPELIDKIASFQARTIMGDTIRKYQEKIVPNVLCGIKEKFPEIYSMFIEKHPEYKDITPNYVGRKAKLISAKDGLEIKTSSGVFKKAGNKMICENYKSVFLPFDAKHSSVEIEIDESMNFVVESNSQVDENTIFV